MLEVEDLRVRYGGAVEALRGITLQVPDGKVVAVLGSNGAGKTTLLRAVSSVLRLHKGRVESWSVVFDGTSLLGKDPAQCVGLGVVQVACHAVEEGRI